MEENDPHDDPTDPWHPLEEHTPQSVSEAGLDLDPILTNRWRLLVLVALLIAAIGALVLVLRDDRRERSVLAVDLGACVTPVVTDVDAPVDEVVCGPGAARLVGRETHPGGPEELHPGDGVLDLFGQGVCQGLAERARLVVAVPSPTSWAAGERAVACLERL